MPDGPMELLFEVAVCRELMGDDQWAVTLWRARRVVRIGWAGFGRSGLGLAPDSSLRTVRRWTLLRVEVAVSEGLARREPLISC